MTTTNRDKVMSRFYMKALVFLAVLTILLMMVESAAAYPGRDDRDCESGESVGYLGIEGLSFKGSHKINTSDGTNRWHFRSEPRIEEIDPDSPAAGILKKGDVIVEIDGMLITTRKAGKRFGNIKPDETVELTVRRKGELIEKKIKADAICLEDHPLHFVGEEFAELELNLEHLSEALEELSELHIEMPELPEMPYITKIIELSELAELAELEHLEALSMLGDLDYWPRAWYGMGISCGGCTIKTSKDGDPAQWQFDNPPGVHSVDEDGPAGEAGIREGDVLTHIDGVRLDTRKGGERFSNAEPGEQIEWTIERDGKSMTVTMETIDRPHRMEVVVPDHRYLHDRAFKLRFSGGLAGADVEVRGTPAVKVTHDEEKGIIIVKTPDASIKIRIADKKK